MENSFDRRSFLRKAGVVGLALGTSGVVAACSSSGAGASSTSTSAETVPEGMGLVAIQNYTLNPKTATNFDVVSDSKTTVGTTYENLVSAIGGETKATTKYSSYAKIAEKAGFTQASRLFTATAAAEKIHIELEFALASKLDSSTTRPTTTAPAEEATDLNLISGANGEIYETSDMYPSFIAVAEKEGNDEAVEVFSRAKLAEAYHAQHYLELYNLIDNPDEDKYCLCPICGYIHKGENFEVCPICGQPKSAFTAY